MADNVKQHVVPRFLISFFCADCDTKVFVRCKGNDIVSLKSPSGQGYEREAFTVVNGGDRDTSCDDANQIIEDWCAPRIAALNGLARPTDDQWQAVFFLTANIISRSRQTRDQFLRQLGKVQRELPTITDILKKLPPLPDAIRPLGLETAELDELPAVMACAAELQYPMTAALGTVPIAEDLKSGRDCDLLVAPSDSAFIFSDEPALILDRGKPIIMKVSPGFLADSAIEVFMPLKPNLACMWSRTSSRSIRIVNCNEVASCNRMIWENCYERVFASRRRDLDQF